MQELNLTVPITDPTTDDASYQKGQAFRQVSVVMFNVGAVSFQLGAITDGEVLVTCTVPEDIDPTALEHDLTAALTYI